MSPIILEMVNRARAQLTQRHLVVDYNRIRRRVALPLPIRSFVCCDMPLTGFESASYPWSIWQVWALEERIGSLGWAASWTNDARFLAAASADLDVLSSWPSYRQLPKPDLCLGHCARLLWRAWRSWTWIDAGLRQSLALAAGRMLDESLAASDAIYDGLHTPGDVLGSPDPARHMHNIPFIGTIGLALAARMAGHPAQTRLDVRVGMLIDAYAALRKEGLSEGASYDGYLLDFILDWLGEQPRGRISAWTADKAIHSIWSEACQLAAPGDALALAEIGDVEPAHMLFHVSAQAKAQYLDPVAERAWYLGRCPISRLRCEALAALHATPTTPSRAPEARAIDAHYAIVLRTGHEPDDLAMAASASGSSMGHIHHDQGSLVIGGHGRWLIGEPGYQQYLEGSERTFTLGLTAHNAPVIDGREQCRKSALRPALSSSPRGAASALFDLSPCYPEDGPSVSREIRLADADTVVVIDRFSHHRPMDIRYHWMGHPDASWCAQSGRLGLIWSDLPGMALWIACSDMALGYPMVHRLRGSRGGMTLCTAHTLPADGEMRWTFTRSACPPHDEPPARGGT